MQLAGKEICADVIAFQYIPTHCDNRCTIKIDKLSLPTQSPPLLGPVPILCDRCVTWCHLASAHWLASIR